MIQVEKLSYGFPAKELYRDISFTLETGRHCALIGSNGTGKSTLADMIMHPDAYFFDGKIVRDESCRIGYASQFSIRDKLQDFTVFAYLSERFLSVQQQIAAVCEEMAEAAPAEMDAVFARYQELLDLNEAMDGDNYESTIRRQLHLAGMENLADAKLSEISGGEYKLLQIMREMLLAPNLLILDEPDVFLDFANLNSLCSLIQSYKGTLLAVTHNRYLLNHCFDQILHLENGELQVFDGTYSRYRCAVLREKLRLSVQRAEEQDEIARTQEMVDILRRRATLMVNPVIGRSVNAKQSQLDRLLERQISAPFIEVREPEIHLPEVVQPENAAEEAGPVLRISDYCTEFDGDLLQHVNFELMPGEKAVIAGANGTGKTSLIRDILINENPSVQIAEGVRYACLSQLQIEAAEENSTVYDLMQKNGFTTKEKIREYLSKFCFPTDITEQRICELSGGEQNLLQIALIANTDAELLILDEPTSHLDLYGQLALEKAIAEYKGAVLMVSHDFYLISGCADYVLLVEDHTVRRMRTKNFRRMVYDRYFDRRDLEIDRRKQELELEITAAFQQSAFAAADRLCTELEELSGVPADR